MGPRVLQVLLSLNPGGTERLVVELVRRLQDEFPMAVCCLDEEGTWGRELRQSGVDVAALGRKSGFQSGLGRAVAAVARQHDADLMHCHHYSPFVYGCFARLWQPRARVIFTEHGRLSDARPSPKRRIVNTFLSRVPAAVFAVSEDLRRHIVEEGFPSGAVQVIHNGIEVGQPQSPATRARIRGLMGVSESAIVVGTIARLDSVKDLGTLISAVARIQSERVVLLIVGDGSERMQLAKSAAAQGVTNRVRFVGHKDDARDWLLGCDIYANSSISEGVSLTILEAMAASLPIVATNVGGTPEVVTSDCGILVPARDADTMALAIRRLIDNATLRCTLGAAGRDRVERQFTIDRMVAAYRAAYLSAA